MFDFAMGVVQDGAAVADDEDIAGRAAPDREQVFGGAGEGLLEARGVVADQLAVPDLVARTGGEGGTDFDDWVEAERELRKNRPTRPGR